MVTDNSEWKPFVYLDCYIKATPEGFACDYREVTHKIPPLHSWYDCRNSDALLKQIISEDDSDRRTALGNRYMALKRSGVTIPEGDIQQEGYPETVDKSDANYQEWHKDYFHFKLMEVDKYSRGFCDSHNRKRQEEGKPPRYIGNTESIEKRRIAKEFDGVRTTQLQATPVERDGSTDIENESNVSLKGTAATQDYDGDINF